MHVYEDPATWTPEPVRPKWQLVLRFIASVVYAPALCVVWVATALAFLAIGLLVEVIAAFSERVEHDFGEFMDRTLERLGDLATWCVWWPEVRHEGDTEYYRARVDKTVTRWTAAASAPRRPKKAKPPVECAIPLHVYRGVGGSYVAEVALAQGWELRPTDARKEVRLWWAAASHVDRVHPA
ncbi:hypothetical protein [Streptomyces lutosisoli]|uniref:Uncharacterized protein n=1 Tax=Streptomyces lutosisoli TaxID=2665721 RepID=A0ABW2VQI8_9ACTN